MVAVKVRDRTTATGDGKARAVASRNDLAQPGSPALVKRVATSSRGALEV
jgi:hypothetical protein